MSKSNRPKARKDDLVTSKVGDETVVYDTETNKASCLNELTTVVWEACDGQTNIASLLDIVRSAGYQDATEQVVLMAIDQLDQAGLLEESFEINENKRKSLNRREILRLLGARAAVVLPVVSTINIQPAIAAASGSLPDGAYCNEDRECISGCCKPSDSKCKPAHQCH